MEFPIHRSSTDLARAAIGRRHSTAHRLLDVSIAELNDAIEVLEAAGLHPEAIQILEQALAQEESAKRAPFRFIRDIRLFQAQPNKALARPLVVQE